jgi:Flp pilus assembly pilin Flp
MQLNKNHINVIRSREMNKRINKNTKGVSLTEYAVILGGMAVTAIVVISTLGANVTDSFTSSNDSFIAQNETANNLLNTEGNGDEITDPETEIPLPCIVYTPENDNEISVPGVNCYDLLTGVDTFDASAHTRGVSVLAAINDTATTSSTMMDNIILTEYDDTYEGGMRGNINTLGGNDTVRIYETEGNSAFGYTSNITYRLGEGDDTLEGTYQGLYTAHQIYTGYGTNTITERCALDEGAVTVVYSQGTTNALTENCQMKLVSLASPSSPQNIINYEYARSQTSTLYKPNTVNLPYYSDTIVNLKAGLSTDTVIDINGLSDSDITIDGLDIRSFTLNLNSIDDPDDVILNFDNKISSGNTNPGGINLNTTVKVTSDMNVKTQDGNLNWNISGPRRIYSDLTQWISTPILDNSEDPTPTATIGISYVTVNQGVIRLYSGTTLRRTLIIDCGLDRCPKTNIYENSTLNFDRIQISDGVNTKEITFNAANPKLQITRVSIASKS